MLLSCINTYSDEQMTQGAATGQSLSEDLSVGTGSGSLSFSGAPVRTKKHDFSGVTLGNRYELVRQLGRGGMATVYRAVDLKLSKPVAVKILNPEHNQAYARRLSEEARAVSQLQHEHIVTVSDVGFDNEHNLAYFVMELCEGRDLGSVLWKGGALPWEQVVEIAIQICGALALAHKHGVIHRDIKPANCMLLAGPEVNIKVLDFGIAKFTEQYFEHHELVWSKVTQDVPTVGLVGTPGYVAPEQLERSADDPRVDIYGLGAMMYRLLTNKMPQPVTGTVHDLPQPLARAVAEGVPMQLAEVILRALAAEPGERFESVGQMERALDGIKPAAASSSILAVTKQPTPFLSRALAFFVPALVVLGLAKYVGDTAETVAAVPPPEASVVRPTVREPLASAPPPTLTKPERDVEAELLPAPRDSEPVPAVVEVEAPVASEPKKHVDTKKAEPRTSKPTRRPKGLQTLKPAVVRCYKQAAGMLSGTKQEVTVHFTVTDGRVAAVEVPGFNMTKMPGCVQRAARKLALPSDGASQVTYRVR